MSRPSILKGGSSVFIDALLVCGFGFVVLTLGIVGLAAVRVLRGKDGGTGEKVRMTEKVVVVKTGKNKKEVME